MSKLVTWDATSFLSEIIAMEEVSRKLASTKHYSKLGPEGVFAVLQMAKVIKMDPLWALNDGMYYLQGRVGLYAKAMNMMVRAAGHSITKDAKSDSRCVILHGKRADNGDTCTVAFTMDMAVKAGVSKAGNNYDKWSEDMLWARALSRLCRQLFADVTAGMYVKEEIDDGPATISEDQARDLRSIINGDDDLMGKVLRYARCERVEDMELQYYQKAMETVIKKLDKVSAVLTHSAAPQSIAPSVFDSEKALAFAEAQEAGSVAETCEEV